MGIVMVVDDGYGVWGSERTFEQDGDALPYSYTHTAQGSPGFLPLQLPDCCKRKPRAAGTQRMAERDGSPIRVYLCGIIRQPKLSGHGQHLRGEGFIEFHQINIVNSESRARKQFGDGQCRSKTHDARGQTCGR